MKALQTLPDGYREIFSVDLAKDKKMMLGLNLTALVVAVLMAIPAAFAVPISTLFDFSNGMLAYCLRFLVLIAGMFSYIVLHELVHGITMKHFGCQKVDYGFTLVYAYAGCKDYFCKRHYIIIALAPVVFWGIVLAVLCLLVPESWFWVVYFIQICNISGAAGDAYVTWKFSRMPADILVQDTGFSMTVYSAS